MAVRIDTFSNCQHVEDGPALLFPPPFLFTCPVFLLHTNSLYEIGGRTYDEQRGRDRPYLVNRAEAAGIDKPPVFCHRTLSPPLFSTFA